MIVAEFEKCWEIYFHKAHALLAMDIGLSIDHKFWPIRKYLAAGLESIGEHDNGQPRWHQRDNLTEKGTPLDYRERTEVDLKQAKSVVNQTQYKSSFVAIMVSLHCQNLYQESTDPDVQKFLAEQKNLRDQYMIHLGTDSQKILQSYQFLRFCDDLSLALCQKEFLQSKEIPIKPITGKEQIILRTRDDGSFILSPWIFFEEQLVFPIEYYRTSKKFFSSDDELKKDIKLESPLSREFVFRK